MTSLTLANLSTSISNKMVYTFSLVALTMLTVSFQLDEQIRKLISELKDVQLARMKSQYETALLQLITGNERFFQRKN